MLRTVISLESNDKKWLDQTAKHEHTTMAEVIRRAVRKYRAECEAAKSPSLDELLNKTRGSWKQGDGLKYQQKIRKEWE